MRIRPREIIHAVLWIVRHVRGQHPVPEASVLESLIDPSDILLDVGAHAGSWSVALSKMVPDGKVYAFEALPYYARVLRMALWGLRRTNVEVIGKAVLDHDNRIDIVWQDNTGNRLTGFTHVKGLDERKEETIPVQGLRLDELIPSFDGRVRFIKMDIEGAELLALKGATKLLDTFRPLVFLELNESYCRRYGHGSQDVFAFLEEKEYTGYLYSPQLSWKRIDAKAHSGDGDVWFLPVEDAAAITDA